MPDKRTALQDREGVTRVLARLFRRLFGQTEPLTAIDRALAQAWQRRLTAVVDQGRAEGLSQDELVDRVAEEMSALSLVIGAGAGIDRLLRPAMFRRDARELVDQALASV